MIAAAYGTASDIEILWVVIALVGVVFTALNLHEAIGDMRFILKHAISNGRKVLARATVETELIRLVIQTLFAAVGILAMTIPEVPDQLDQPLNVTVTGFLIRWGLILASGLLTYKTYLARKVRRTLRAGT